MTLSVEKTKQLYQIRQSEESLLLLHIYPDITEPETSLNYKLPLKVHEVITGFKVYFKLL